MTAIKHTCFCLVTHRMPSRNTPDSAWNTHESALKQTKFVAPKHLILPWNSPLTVCPEAHLISPETRTWLPWSTPDSRLKLTPDCVHTPDCALLYLKRHTWLCPEAHLILPKNSRLIVSMKHTRVSPETHTWLCHEAHLSLPWDLHLILSRSTPDSTINSHVFLPNHTQSEATRFWPWKSWFFPVVHLILTLKLLTLPSSTPDSDPETPDSSQ